MKINKQKTFYFIFLFIACFGLFSCQFSKTPLEVSEQFWSGIKQNKAELVQKHSLSDYEIIQSEFEQLPEITNTSFGRIIIDDDIAEVETIVIVLSEGKTVDVSLITFLNRENNDWKVDYERTVIPLTVKQEMAELFGDINEMTEEFAEEIEESVEEFKEKALPEIKSKLEQAEQELREKLPELKDMIDDFLQELEKSIEEAIPPPAEEEAKTQQT